MADQWWPGIYGVRRNDPKPELEKSLLKNEPASILPGNITYVDMKPPEPKPEPEKPANPAS